MFTGLVETIGVITEKITIDGGFTFQIQPDDALEDLGIGDSICVDGVCLTVVELSKNWLRVTAVGETLDKTNFAHKNRGERVNLERAMSAAGRFGGHIVQGHVNAVARISKWHARGENWYLEIELPKSLRRYVIPEGSITLDGISLTVAVLDDRRAGFNIIPHTAAVTTLADKQPGNLLNVEVDVIAKYVENLLKYAPENLYETTDSDQSREIESL